MISPKDLSMISAYLDQALEQRERAQLETRLNRDPELQAELDALRMVRQTLRAAPQMRAPRNFTLTPEMAGSSAPARSRLYPAARVSFALASFVFIFTMIGNFTFGQLPVNATAFDAPPAAESASDAAASSEQQLEMEALSVEAGATEESAAGAAGETGLAPPEGTATVAPTGDGMTEEAVAESLESLAPPTGEAYSVYGADATPTPASSARSAATEQVSKLPGDASDADAAQDAIPPSYSLSPWTLAAVLSGAGVLLTGLLLFLLRRK